MMEAAVATPRRLLVVDPCEGCERLMLRLRASGWSVDSCGLGEASGGVCDVGLIRLRAEHLTEANCIKELIRRSGAEWIAVLDPEVLTSHEGGAILLASGFLLITPCLSILTTCMSP